MTKSAYACGLPTRPTAFEPYQWCSESPLESPQTWLAVGDDLSADQAISLAKMGVGMIWQGDFHNARQLLIAMSKRLASKRQTAQLLKKPILERFHVHRLHQSQRLNMLSKLLIPVDASYKIHLQRAPEISEVLSHVWGPLAPQAKLISLRELLGFIGAYEWFKKGLELKEDFIAPAPMNKIHPAYGVFSPLRGEYLSLVHQAPLDALAQGAVAFDIGVGTGVISAMLLRRGFSHVVATDSEERAIECARDNLSRLELADRVSLLQCDLFPPSKANLIVCNPPWLPGKARSNIEKAIFDENSHMLKGFLNGLKNHLEPQGEGWLIMSDLAERLGLRAADELRQWIANADLRVVQVTHTKAHHAKAMDKTDPFYEARSQELTSLWRLKLAKTAQTET